jgi:hypothetical protein
VFDPLALVLLLAATKTLEWERGINIMSPAARRPNYEPDDGPLTDEQLDQLRATAKGDLPTGQVTTKESLFDPEATEFFDRAREKVRAIDTDTYEPPEQELVKKKSILSGLDSMWDRAKKLVVRDSEAEHAPLHESIDQQEEKDWAEKEARRRWKEDHPEDTIHRQERLFGTGKIDSLPWHLQELELQADNMPARPQGEVKGFGTSFPADPVKGDMFLRVDHLPSVLYKYNGASWIEVDKSLSDQHAYDDAYIDHLIEKIGSGEYDPDLLSDAERDRIEEKLRINK